MGKLVVGDCTAFAIFHTFKDGKWHSITELRKKHGNCADKRARELRSEKYGAFEIERKLLENISYYRLSRFSLRKREREAAYMSLRQLPVIIDRVDFVRNVKLRNSDIIFLLALVNNSPQLNHSKVKLLWDETRSRLSFKLESLLSDSLRDPFDLFE